MKPDDTATLLRLVELAFRRAQRKQMSSAFESAQMLKVTADELAHIAQAMETGNEEEVT